MSLDSITVSGAVRRYRQGARPAVPPWRAVLDAADRKLSHFERTLTRAARTGQEAIDGHALGVAFEQRSERWLGAVLDAGLAAMYEGLRRWLPGAVIDTMAAGAEAAARDARAKGGFRFARDRRFDNLHFDLVNPEAVAWAEKHSAQLIQGVSAETREAIRAIITRSFTEGITTAEAARLIRPLVGLNPAHAEAVLNLRQAILANPGKKLWAGSMPIRVPRGGATADFLARRTEQYATRLLNYRARVIARTETIAASNMGQLQLWKQAVDKGLLRGTEYKQWIVTPDDRLCTICEGIPRDGPVPLDQPFPSVGVQGPPAHPSCRCTMGLSRRRSAQKLRDRMSALKGFDPKAFATADWNLAANRMVFDLAGRFGLTQVNYTGMYLDATTGKGARAFYSATGKNIHFGPDASDAIRGAISGQAGQQEAWSGLETVFHELGHAGSSISGTLARDYRGLGAFWEEGIVELRARQLTDHVLGGGSSTFSWAYSDNVSAVQRILDHTQGDIEALLSMSATERAGEAARAGGLMFMDVAKRGGIPESWATSTVQKMNDYQRTVILRDNPELFIRRIRKAEAAGDTALAIEEREELKSYLYLLSQSKQLASGL